MTVDRPTMQSTDEKGCDEVTDESGAVDICAHCAADDKLQPGLYYCFQCGSFGRYMCGDCNMKHRKYEHEVKSISDAAQQKEQNIFSFERGCDASEDDNEATDICAHCASESNIQPAFYFCFHCGPFGRYMCENCNKHHKRFANVHEVGKLSREALQTREMTVMPPTPKHRVLPDMRTKAKVEMPQLVTKSMETAKIIEFSGRTDNAVDTKSKTPATTDNVMSSKSEELKTMPVLQRVQGMYPYKQRNISKIRETRKHDHSNIEQVEQQAIKMEIQAADKETDVNRREIPTIPPSLRQRPGPAMRTKTKVDMPQVVTKSVTTGEFIKDSGRTEHAVDKEATEPSETENVKRSFSVSVKKLKSMIELQTKPGDLPYKQRNITKITETRKLDHSNVDQVLEQTMNKKIQADEKETDIVNEREMTVMPPTPKHRVLPDMRYAIFLTTMILIFTSSCLYCYMHMILY